MKHAFRHALVIGKFYPPQAGHRHLIRAAARVSDRVTVVAMPATTESIPMDLRIAWLREAFQTDAHVRITGVLDDIPVDYNDSAIWEQHVELMRQAVSQIEGALPESERAGPVDAVFTSEHYGAELARRFGATSVVIDPPREVFPVSGTAVRNDPLANWDYLDAPVRAWLCHRVVVVGAESSGTTTLSKALAAHYRKRGGFWGATPWVAEYGREYSHDKLAIARTLDLRDGRPPRPPSAVTWESSEFPHIARTQTAREDAAARAGSPLIVCDTDAFATGVWHERYIGEALDAPEFDVRQLTPRLLYVLTDWRGVPFEQDGLRDGEHLRAWMHDRFIERLNAATVDWIQVSGEPEVRLAAASSAIDARLAKGWRFSPPLG